MSTWLTAGEAAEYLGVSVKHVRRHAAALGAVKLGTGRNAPLRFKASVIDRRILTAYQLDPNEELAPPLFRRMKMSQCGDKSRPTEGFEAKEDRDVG
jgi:excisionase family DNA binding protein